MSNATQPQQMDSPAAPPPLPFAKMNVVQKLAHLAKVAVFFLTLGFAFPNVLVD